MKVARSRGVVAGVPYSASIRAKSRQEPSHTLLLALVRAAPQACGAYPDDSPSDDGKHVEQPGGGAGRRGI